MTRAGPRVRTVQTPEGVPLRLELAPLGDRVFAQLVDQLLILLVVGSLGLLVLFSSFSGSALSHLAEAVLLAVAFFVRSLYFIVFETGPRGATPGKRLAGIRVVDRSGGALRLSAVVARNVIRDVELFVPLVVLFAPGVLWPGAPRGLGWAGGLWALALTVVPWLNRDRLRLGDLLGNTLVVLRPSVMLLDDLGAHAAGARGPSHHFTPEQLGHYGTYELQTLEQVLRRGDSASNREAIAAVAAQVRLRIGHAESSRSEFWFLRDFYAAQRAHLEHRLQFGVRKERKSARPR